MAYPGLTFAIMIGVAIGTAIYYYFNSENNQQQRQQSYASDNYNSGDHSVDYNSWNSSSSSGSQRRRRRNSTSKCTICLEDNPRLVLECGHAFHNQCIVPWLQENKICPNCRKPVFM